MPGEGVYLLSDHGGEPVGVLCEECELLKFISTAELMIEYGDHSMPSLLNKISQHLLKCPKRREGFSDRCMLKYYDRPESLIAKLKREREPVVRITDIQSWEVVVAKCNYCAPVSNVPHWQLRKIAGGGSTIDDLSKRLRCKKCKVKGDVKITIAKLPR